MSRNLCNIGQLHDGVTLFLLQESLATHGVQIKSVKEVLKRCEATESFVGFFIPHRNYRLFTIYKTFSRKSGWKVNGTRLFESFRRKIPGRNGTSEKVVLFFWTEYFKLKFVIHFSKAVFDTSFRLSRSFFSNGTDWEEIFQS